MNGRSVFYFFVAATIPALLFLNVFQSFRYEKLKSEISRLEQEQRELIDSNKRLVTNIAELKSPERIAELAKKDPRLAPLVPSRILKIERNGERSGVGE
jgi:cell division protein FtsL